MSVHSIEFEKRDDYGNYDSNLLFLEKTSLLKKDIKILEIGCGTCRLLSQLFSDGYNVQGVDINSRYLDQGKKLYGNLPVQCVDSEILPFADNSFDLILSFDVFEHIPKSDNHLTEVTRVLKENGNYLLQTPNRYTNVIFETIRWKSISSWREDHCSLHSYWELKKRFSQHGYELFFYDVPVVTEYFKKKVYYYLGSFGLLLLKAINIDKLPICLRTNFYLTAQKMDIQRGNKYN